MYITCLDVEGVLVPEIWVAFAEASGIPELKRTTRDEPDYNKLMRWRLDTLKAHGLGIKEIQETISKIDPLPGAKESFLVIPSPNLQCRSWKSLVIRRFSATVWKLQKTARSQTSRCVWKIPN